MIKRIVFLLVIVAVCSRALAGAPDSVWLFAYAKVQHEGRDGLHFAWSNDGKSWHAIGQEFGFVRSDYGRWGSEKRMIQPVLFPGTGGTWHCVWNLTGDTGPVAYTASQDLVRWIPQSYYADLETVQPVSAPQVEDARKRQTEVLVLGVPRKGSRLKVSWTLVDGLLKKEQLTGYRNQLWGETTHEDSARFATLKPVMVSIRPEIARSKKIGNMLMGVFFEDINYAADGGLYAELVQNRGFEYDPADKENRDPDWNAKKAWSVSGKGLDFAIASVDPIHSNNKHYAVLRTDGTGGALVNEGFDGMVIKAGERYDLSLFARSLSGKNNKLAVRLKTKDGTVVAASVINGLTPVWKKQSLVLVAKETVTDARLELIPQAEGALALDMISLFPRNTFKGRKNGLRADLAQHIADLHPRFIRFPGGCVAHGDGIENIYNWKNTIGPLEARKPQRNLWGYHQSMGLGYFEYFRFCEDIGAEPVPVVAAGVPCQNSAQHGHPLGGQQCGIPLKDMNRYIQDVLDLVEWANGDVHTQWGRQRAAAGHPEPFHLKYIGIGNEDLISDVFTERFIMIYNAVKKKYPDVTVIGTVGPFFEGSDYDAGWKLASRLQVPMVDEHYYVPPGWFIYNQDFYDQYDRNGPKVYLGEYAAHLPGRPNNLETALAEALHLTALERNGDVVRMASYAPLLAKEGHTQWSPDLIYFNNSMVKPTTGYYVQQLFGQNAGETYIPAKAVFSNNNEKIKARVAWSIVKDAKTGDVILKLVNLLPVAAQARLDVSALGLHAAPVTKMVLTGRPDEKNLKPVKTTVSLNELEKTEMPPYSITVLRAGGPK
ncbi:alpha-L-arabinofuranosidase [Niabella sp. CC-SYL272]|uniref:alpha-L-arabinofuranosidase C-terminal domain-containing protein n=1 Tax=Niabella agricola TaxID=2891571 RepID=UPI001F1C939F|nr:alpha-L-arabinofuranosidase C-terminal domain-containing protein [Niabella agricola]MCF3107372.1 alpha-L-arabinofuranosidase [Niabella agricola]